MITLWSQVQAPPVTISGGGGALVAYIALAASILTPLIALINAWAQRRSKRERDATAKNAEAQGHVLSTGSPLEWRTTDHQALMDERTFSRELRKRADTAEAKVRELEDRLAENDRRTDAIIEDLRQLRVSIAACPGGPVCPLRPALPIEPHDG